MSSKIRSTLVVLILTLSLPILAAPQKPLHLHWRDANLSYDLVRNQLTPKRCYQDEKTFIACIHSLKSLLRHSPANVTLTPLDRFESEKGFGPVVQDFGLALAVPPRVLKAKSPTELFKAYRKDLLTDNKAWGNTYLSMAYMKFFVGNLFRIEFPDILTWIADTFVTKKNTSFLTAMAINGYLASAMDPHTYILPTSHFKQRMKRVSDEWVGIGALVDYIKGRYIIRTPIEDGPAHKAGIRAKDVITHINGKDIRKFSPTHISKLLRGPKGTVVTVNVSRKKYSAIIRITRDKVVIENVLAKIMFTPHHVLGYIKQRQFSRSSKGKKITYSTCYEVAKYIYLMTKSRVKKGKKPIEGLILDLRNNPGGLTTQSACISALFLKPGLDIMTSRDITGKHVRGGFRSTNGFKFTDPVVVLINDGSASASEVVAGALQDHRRALIVGEQSFGKGSIQGGKPWDLAPKKVMLFKTVGRIYTPSGRTTQILGITPDLFVYEHPEPKWNHIFAMREKDTFVNALPPLGKKWKQTRPNYIRKIETCVKKEGYAKRRFKKGQSNALPPDYQLYYAQDVLSCVLDN